MNTKPFFTKTRLLGFAMLGLLSLGAMRLLAQDPDQQGSQNPGYQEQGQPLPDNDINYNGDPQQDPPSRVARLSYIDGSVSFQPGGQGEWGAATRNRPVTIGDKIWSDNNARAELQAGQASIHVSSMTALSFLNLDDQTTQMRLAEGTIRFRVREMREGDVYEVDTPNVAFTVTQAGAFRVEVNENGDGTRVTAIRGEGQVVANGQTYSIRAGERGEFNGNDNVSYFVASAPAPDDFDRWSDDRDRRDDNSISAKYVSRDVPGYADLDDNGTWSEEPDYGPVWYPNAVDVGWAPYSYGYWNYIGPWGWTWVDYSPWGFAPYHYGRWAFIGSRWGWCPGPYYARPIYGPAFVGFLGGSHWGVGFSFGGGWGGGIGWFPLGPRECYRPWYRTSSAYYHNVNVRNTSIRNTNVFNTSANNYAYAHNVRAVTVASRNNFVGGQAINRGAFRVSQASLRGAQVMNRANFAPTRQSFMGAASQRGNIARPSQAIENRYVVARNTPAGAASRMPVRTFGNGNNSGRGFDNNRQAMGRAAQMNAATNRPSFANGGNTNRGYGNGGFHSDANRPNPAGNRVGGNQSIQNRGPSNQGRGGWDNNQAGTTARQRELAQDKPQSHMRRAPESGNGRSWSAQGNTTDHGRAPAGFASDARNNSSRDNAPNRPADASANRGSSQDGTRNSNTIRGDRPSWVGGSNRANGSNAAGGNRADGNSRSYNPPQPGAGGYASDRPHNANGNRSYDAPQRGSGGFGGDRPANRGNGNARSYNPPQRSYGGLHDRPSSYNMGGNRSYSQPNYGNRGSSQTSFGGRSAQPSFGNRGFSQPRYSAPSRSYGGGGGGRPSGGGAPRSSGGGGPRGGGGSPHGGGSSHGRH
jgi:uncharacterized protein DUF6600